MPKIYIIHENEQWFAPVAKALSEKQLPFESIFIAEGSIDLTKPPQPGVYFSKLSASCASRNHAHAPDYAATLLAWLEVNGVRVINGSRVLRLEISKADQYIRLKRAGFNVPKTIVCFDKKSVVEAAKSFNGPFILKPNRGGKGLGVNLIRSKDALENALHDEKYVEPVDGITLAQDYIQAPEPFITRAEFIGGKFIYAVRVDTSEGFELCPAEACRIAAPAPAEAVCAIDASEGLFRIIPNFDDPVIKKLQKFLSDNEIEVAGVEFIRDKNGLIYIYDINTNTNYNPEAEKKAGLYALPQLADFLARELKKTCLSRQQSLKIAGKIP